MRTVPCVCSFIWYKLLHQVLGGCEISSTCLMIYIINYTFIHHKRKWLDFQSYSCVVLFCVKAREVCLSRAAAHFNSVGVAIVFINSMFLLAICFYQSKLIGSLLTGKLISALKCGYKNNQIINNKIILIYF